MQECFIGLNCKKTYSHRIKLNRNSSCYEYPDELIDHRYRKNKKYRHLEITRHEAIFHHACIFLARNRPGFDGGMHWLHRQLCTLHTPANLSNHQTQWRFIFHRFPPYIHESMALLSRMRISPLFVIAINIYPLSYRFPYLSNTIFAL